jgi:hypothetical protein
VLSIFENAGAFQETVRIGVENVDTVKRLSTASDTLWADIRCKQKMKTRSGAF